VLVCCIPWHPQSGSRAESLRARVGLGQSHDESADFDRRSFPPRPSINMSKKGKTVIVTGASGILIPRKSPNIRSSRSSDPQSL
jgi:hypothetical protein